MFEFSIAMLLRSDSFLIGYCLSRNFMLTRHVLFVASGLTCHALVDWSLPAYHAYFNRGYGNNDEVPHVVQWNSSALDLTASRLGCCCWPHVLLSNDTICPQEQMGGTSVCVGGGGKGGNFELFFRGRCYAFNSSLERRHGVPPAGPSRCSVGGMWYKIHTQINADFQIFLTFFLSLSPNFV